MTAIFTRETLANSIQRALRVTEDDPSIEVFIIDNTVSISFGIERNRDNFYNYLVNNENLFPNQTYGSWQKNGRFYVSHKLNQIQKNLIAN